MKTGLDDKNINKPQNEAMDTLSKWQKKNKKAAKILKKKVRKEYKRIANKSMSRRKIGFDDKDFHFKL